MSKVGNAVFNLRRQIKLACGPDIRELDLQLDAMQQLADAKGYDAIESSIAANAFAFCVTVTFEERYRPHAGR